MSVAEPLDVQTRLPGPLRPHAAVAGLVGGPYPNLGAGARRARPRLVAAGDAPEPRPADVDPEDPETPGPALDVQRRPAELAPGGPYPNLPTARR